MERSLDEPMSVTTAKNVIINTIHAKVKVAIITNAAVIMFLGNGAATVVAVNAEDGRWEVMEGRQAWLRKGFSSA